MCGEGEYEMVRADGGCEKFGPAATTQELSEKLLKFQADFRGGLMKCASFKTQAVEAENLRVFVGMVKGYADFKLFHSILK